MQKIFERLTFGRFFIVFLLFISIVKATDIATDDFECNAFNCGTGWNGAWSYSGLCEITTLSSPQGTYQMRGSASCVATRNFDDVDFGVASVSFWATATSLESADFCRYYYFDGASYQELLVLADGQDDGALKYYTFNVTPQDVNAGLRMVSPTTTGDYCYIDSITISGTESVPQISLIVDADYPLSSQAVVRMSSSKGNADYTLVMYDSDNVVFCNKSMTSPSIPKTEFTASCAMPSSEHINSRAVLTEVSDGTSTLTKYFNVRQFLKDPSKISISNIYFSLQVLQGSATEVFAVIDGVPKKSYLNIVYPDQSTRRLSMDPTVNDGEYRAFITDTFRTGYTIFTVRVEDGIYYDEYVNSYYVVPFSVDYVKNVGNVSSVDKLNIAKMEIFGTEYDNTQTAKLWLQLLDGDGEYVNDGSCLIDIYTPDNEEYIERASMTAMVHDGIYYYDLPAPQSAGVYPVIARCYYESIEVIFYFDSYSINNGTGAITYSPYATSGFSLEETSGTNIANSVDPTWNATIISATINQGGRIGKSYYFDGTDDYLVLNDSSGKLDWASGDNLMWCHSFKTTSISGRTFMSNIDVGSTEITQMEILSNGRVKVTVKRTGGTSSMTSSSSYNDNLWHTFCMYSNGITGQTGMYVDNGLISTSTGGTGANDMLSRYYGTQYDGSKDYEGYMDELCSYKWTGSTVTFAEVVSHYQTSGCGALLTPDMAYSNATDGVYTRFQEELSGGIERLDISLTDGDLSGCADVSEDFLTGLNIHLYGKFDSVPNDNIAISIWNYTSSSWLVLANPLSEGLLFRSADNTILTNNITASGLYINSTSSVKIRLQDSTYADTVSNVLYIDEVHIGCDQKASPTWTEVRGSSEMHVASKADYPFYVQTLCGAETETESTSSSCAEFRPEDEYWNYTWGYIFENITFINSYATDIIDEFRYETQNGLDCTALIDIYREQDGGTVSIVDDVVLSAGSKQNCIIDIPIEFAADDRSFNIIITQDNYMLWEVLRARDMVEYYSLVITPFCQSVSDANDNPFEIPIEESGEESDIFSLYGQQSIYIGCYHAMDDLYWFSYYFNASLEVDISGEFEAYYIEIIKYYLPEIRTNAQTVQTIQGDILDSLFHVDTLCGHNFGLDHSADSSCAVAHIPDDYFSSQEGYIVENLTISNLFNSKLTAVYTYIGSEDVDCTSVLSVMTYRGGVETEIYDDILFKTGSEKNCIMTIPIHFNESEEEYNIEIFMENYVYWNIFQMDDKVKSIRNNTEDLCLTLADTFNVTYALPINGSIDYLLPNLNLVYCYRAIDDLYWWDYFMDDFFTSNVNMTENIQMGSIEGAYAELVYFYPSIIDSDSVISTFLTSPFQRTTLGQLATIVANMSKSVWEYENRTLTQGGISFIGGTEYQPSQDGLIGVRLIKPNGDADNGATCNVTILYSNQSSLLSTEMEDIGYGIYLQNFTVPSYEGMYIYFTDCISGGQKYKAFNTFHVSTILATTDLSSVISLINIVTGNLSSMLLDLDYIKQFSSEQVYLITDSMVSLNKIADGIKSGKIDDNTANIMFGETIENLKSGGIMVGLPKSSPSDDKFSKLFMLIPFVLFLLVVDFIIDFSRKKKQYKQSFNKDKDELINK